MKHSEIIQAILNNRPVQYSNPQVSGWRDYHGSSQQENPFNRPNWEWRIPISLTDNANGNLLNIVPDTNSEENQYAAMLGPKLMYRISFDSQCGWSVRDAHLAKLDLEGVRYDFDSICVELQKLFREQEERNKLNWLTEQENAHQAEDAESLHLKFDSIGVPRNRGDNSLSLWGRVCAYMDVVVSDVNDLHKKFDDCNVPRVENGSHLTLMQRTDIFNKIVPDDYFLATHLRQGFGPSTDTSSF